MALIRTNNPFLFFIYGFFCGATIYQFSAAFRTFRIANILLDPWLESIKSNGKKIKATPQNSGKTSIN